MTGHFRGKFSCNIRLITAFVFITAAGFIMILVIGVTGYAQTPVPTIGRTIINMPTAGPTIAVTPKPLPAPSKNVKEAAAILQHGGKIAEGTFNACIINLYVQGLPTKDVIEQCSIKLIKHAETGFGKGLPPEMEVGGNKSPWFDPTKITAACSSAAGSGIAEGGGTPAPVPAPAPADAAAKAKAKAKAEAKAKADAEAKAEAKAKAEAEAKALAAAKAAAEIELARVKKEQKEAITKAENARLAREAAARDFADAKAAEMAAKAAEDLATAKVYGVFDVFTRLSEASDRANANLHKQEMRDPSACEQALQEAREILYECNRNGWKSSQCQQLQAKMYGCPDPTQIFVDPDAGYVCGGKLDAKTKQALKDAWVARCEELKDTVGPEANPCQPPVIDEAGRYIKGNVLDVCKPDPHTHIAPGSEACIVEFEVHPFGEVNIQKIVVFALNHFGGPLFVPPPKGGPTPVPHPPR